MENKEEPKITEEKTDEVVKETPKKVEEPSFEQKEVVQEESEPTPTSTPKAEEQEKKPGLYTAGLICGIVGLCLFWSVWIGLICGILGIVFGAVAFNKGYKNKTPIILGGIATVLAIIMMIVYPIIVKNAFNKVVDEFKDGFNNALKETEDENGKNALERLEETLEEAIDENTNKLNTQNNEVNLTNEQAYILIESKRISLNYNNWRTEDAKVIKKGDNNYYLVTYTEVNNDGYNSTLNVIFHYENGEWTFNLPGFSEITKEDIEKYNFVDVE